MWPSLNFVYNCHNPKELKFITSDIEPTEHFLLHCPQFVNERHTPLSTISNTNYKLLENADLSQSHTYYNMMTSFKI